MMGTAGMCTTALSVTLQEHFVAYCGCKDVAKLFMFLLSLYSLGGLQECEE
jgi:hypothetical protein